MLRAAPLRHRFALALAVFSAAPLRSQDVVVSYKATLPLGTSVGLLYLISEENTYNKVV
jgi:hypothetical protein